MKIVFLFVVVTIVDVIVATDIISAIRAFKGAKEGDDTNA